MRRLLILLSVVGPLLFFTLYGPPAKAQLATPPTVVSVTPDTGQSDDQTAVTIAGQGFVASSEAYLDGISLIDVTFVNSTELLARVPFGLSAGTYSLTVTNPLPGTLPNAFTVAEGTIGWASGGPYGGATRDIEIHPTSTNTVYVAVGQSGLYRSGDGGHHWEYVLHSGAMNVGTVHVWPANPEVVFFGGEDGLYRSTQGGDAGTWNRVSVGGHDGKPVNALAIAPSDPYAIYCAIDNALLYSVDGGMSWQERSTGLSGAPWLLAVDPNDSTVAYAAFQERGTLYKTTDSGQLWQELPFSIPQTTSGEGGICVMAADPYRKNTIWLGTWMSGLHRSVDGGQTFTEVLSLRPASQQSGFWSISFDPNQDRIFVGLSGPNDAIYYSDDGGGSWIGLGLNNQGGADVAVAPGQSSIIYTSWSGVRKSVDGGQTWTWLSEGITGVSPRRIVVSPRDPKRLLAVADADGAFGTHDMGNSWETYAISSTGESHQYGAAAFDSIVANVAYIGGTGRAFRTIDDGRSWQATADMPMTGLPASYDIVRPLFIVVHPQDHTKVYAGVSFESSESLLSVGALYRSDNTAHSWTRVTATGPISPVNRVVIAPNHPQVLYLGTGSDCHWCDGNGIWRSTDGGQTWYHPNTEVSGHRVLALAVHPYQPGTLLAGVWSGANDGRGIFRSANGGNSWQPAVGLNEGEELKVTDIVYNPVNPQVVYAATHGGLRISDDGGSSWQAYSGPMGYIPITALAISNDGATVRIYAATVGGFVVRLPDLQHAGQTRSLMGAGVYVNVSQWHFLHLPLVQR